MENKMIKAMVAGHICLDILPGFNANLRGGFDEIFAPGKLINIENAVIGTGGAVSNTGLAMAKLGIDVKLNGKVGDDHFGYIIKQIVGNNRAGSFKTVNGQSSSYSIVLALPGIDRMIVHHPGTNDTFTADDIDYAALSECSLFHFGYPTLMHKIYSNDGEQLCQIYRKAKQLGVATSLDVTVPDPCSDSGKADWLKILKNTLPFVDIFLPSIEEIAYMLDRDLFETRKSQYDGNDPVMAYTGEDCSELADKMLGFGVKIAVIKAGIKGLYLRTADKDALSTLAPIKDDVESWYGREIWCNSYKAEKFGSAAGAGDATIAGFLTAFLHGLDPVKSVKTANMLGWQNVRQVDTLSGIEDWHTTLEMISKDDKCCNLFKVGENWRYCSNKKVYYGHADKIITK